MKHVLVVESDTSTARLMGWILTEAGYAVDIVPDPEHGVRQVAQAPPSVVILNGSRSAAEASGWIERMRERAPETRFVDVVKAASRQGRLPDGATALYAPFDADTLIRVVHEAECGEECLEA
jgi:DNA-binding response OmpR family regulator